MTAEQFQKILRLVDYNNRRFDFIMGHKPQIEVEVHWQCFFTAQFLLWWGHIHGLHGWVDGIHLQEFLVFEKP